MLFGGLFSATSLLRVGADAWPHGCAEHSPGHRQHVSCSYTSSITTCGVAWVALKNNQFSRFKLFHASHAFVRAVFPIASQILRVSRKVHAL